MIDSRKLPKIGLDQARGSLSWIRPTKHGDAFEQGIGAYSSRKACGQGIASEFGYFHEGCQTWIRKRDRQYYPCCNQAIGRGEHIDWQIIHFCLAKAKELILGPPDQVSPIFSRFAHALSITINMAWSRLWFFGAGKIQICGLNTEHWRWKNW